MHGLIDSLKSGDIPQTPVFMWPCCGLRLSIRLNLSGQGPGPMNASSTPDFRAGIEVQQVPDGAIVPGRVDSEEAILTRRGDAYFAVGAQCTHYHGALALGLVVDDTVRCPSHHACFSLRTGAALRAPALDPIACWRAERVGGKVFVRERLPEAPAPDWPAAVGAKAQ